MKLGEIARRLGCELRGDPELEIRGVAGIEEARGDQLTFLGNPKYAVHLSHTGAGAIILPEGGPEVPLPRLVTGNPYLAFARAIALFYEAPAPPSGVHETAVVSESAVLGERCSVGPHCVVGEGVRIGSDSVLHPGVIIYPFAEIGDGFVAHAHAVVREHCRIGNRVILQNGAVIGADGFGFAPTGRGSYHKIPQSGIVVLEDDVEIGANTCVDRATVGETRIRRGTKLDNLVQVGHGSTVGADAVIAAQVGMAGSTRVGARVMLGGQVGIAGHLSLGDGVRVVAQSGIHRSVEAGRVVAGSPAVDARIWKRNIRTQRDLPEMARTVRDLRRRVAALEERLP